MTDPTELARLTGIPDLREVWVLGNPFTRTHSSYRVTIFNLFRNTPGYTEDITIDTSGPGYTERRHLVERVAEKPNVPVVKPPPPNYGLSAVEVNKPVINYPAQREPAVLRKERPKPTHTTSEIHTSSSGRRRRTPKRRIVDLSTSETSPSKPAVKFTAEEATVTAGSDSGYGVSPDPSPQTVPSYVPPEPRKSQSSTDIPRIDTSVVPQLPPIESLSYEGPLIKPQTDLQDWKISGEIYKKKLEALRTEVGNGWLSVLSEEGWDSQKNSHQSFAAPDYSPASTIRPSPTTPRANSQQTIQSGRTLG